MKAKRLIVIAVLILLLAGASPAGAQDVVNLSIDDLAFEGFPTTQAWVTVRNENGVPILGLGPEVFEIVEDGRTSFPPAAVEPHVNPDAVISLVLVIDVSGSMRGKPIEGAMEAANALLDQLGAEDRVAIIAFADQVNTDPNVLDEGKELAFTEDKNAARNVVNFINTKIGWDTPLYDAVYKGVKMVSTEPVGKRAVIVMTDGMDERDNADGVPVKDAGSLSTPDDPIYEANRHHIPIFAVGLGDKIDTKYLQRLGDRTGGSYQQTPKPEELTPLFQNVLNQLKQQYKLTYASTLPEDENYHSLLVRVQLPQGQAFAESKFQFVSDEPLPPPPADTAEPEQTTAAGDVATPEQAATAAGSGDTSPRIVAEANPASAAAAQQPTPEPETSGVQGIVDKIQDTVEERPLLAAVIGGGVVLLLLLLIALLIVLLRGRGGGAEEYATEDFDDMYAPSPGWSEGPTTPGTPVMGAPPEGRTEVATSDWAGPGEPPPGAPGPAMPPRPAPGMAAGVDVPVAGGTRIIERAPKHLAMLVDKANPDRKHDLKGTTNIGRASDNHLVLDDPTVSRHHAWIKAQGEEFLIFDIGSANGTFVNDQQVEQPHPLQNGDVVRFGDVELVFTKVF